MFNSYTTTTLQFNRALCNNCLMCTSVCPHAVYSRINGIVSLAHAEKCMECGACMLNCPTGAITVESGVGCAAAMMWAAVKGKKEPVCGSCSPAN